MPDPKVMLVTGASRGLGRQLALDASRHGLTVAVNYVSSAAAAQEVADLIQSAGGQAMLVRADVGAGAEVRAMVSAVVERFGRIDCVVNNAGVGPIVSLDAIDEEQFRQTLQTNLTEPSRVCRRLQTLRGWSDDDEEDGDELLARGAGTCGAAGA